MVALLAKVARIIKALRPAVDDFRLNPDDFAHHRHKVRIAHANSPLLFEDSLIALLSRPLLGKSVAIVGYVVANPVMKIFHL